MSHNLNEIPMGTIYGNKFGETETYLLAEKRYKDDTHFSVRYTFWVKGTWQSKYTNKIEIIYTCLYALRFSDVFNGSTLDTEKVESE